MNNFKVILNRALPLLLFMLIVLVCADLSAQCAMCKAQAQTSLQENDPDASSLNMAILYLFLTSMVYADVSKNVSEYVSNLIPGNIPFSSNQARRTGSLSGTCVTTKD